MKNSYSSIVFSIVIGSVTTEKHGKGRNYKSHRHEGLGHIFPLSSYCFLRASIILCLWRSRHKLLNEFMDRNLLVFLSQCLVHRYRYNGTARCCHRELNEPETSIASSSKCHSSAVTYLTSQKSWSASMHLDESVTLFMTNDV